MTKRIKMTGADGHEEYWTFERIECVHLLRGHKPRKATGWQFTSADGVQRFSDGNWLNFVPYFHLVAGNYGLTSHLS